MSSFRLGERLGPADGVTALNSVLGVVALLAGFVADPSVVARLLLLAAIADGLDGIVARRFGGTTVGPTLDAMADVVSFGAVPAVFVFVVVRDAWGPLSATPGRFALAVAVPALFVVCSLIRSAIYTVHIPEDVRRPGVQNTLAASILAAAYLAGITNPVAILLGAAMLAGTMIAPIPYPKLHARDAILMGAVQAGAIVRPAIGGRILPRVLLIAALAYMMLAPRFYWSD